MKVNNKVLTSIYAGYPFTEQWEVEQCKRVIDEAIKWGAIQDEALKKQRHENIEKFYKNYNVELLVHFIEN